MIKAVALVSGGLDSSLAVKLVQDQGIEVRGVNFVSCFIPDRPKRSTSLHRGSQLLSSQRPDWLKECGQPGHTLAAYPAIMACEQLGIPLKAIEITEELIWIINNPKHGYGRHMNPCIDCRILTFGIAKEYMSESGASFLVTGEVLGQRPMSQRRDAMRTIDREAGTEGLVLRPLSARLLPMTLPERQGWVDREELLFIQGRSRKEQLRLAESYGMHDYLSGTGGCLLTSEGFANKVRDLIAHKHPDANDMMLLRVGRHFRLPQGGKAVVGRNKEENRRIVDLARDGDIIFGPRGNLPIPTSLLRDSRSGDEIRITADLCVSHSKLRSEPSVPIQYYRHESPGELRVVSAGAMPRETVDSLRI